MTLTMGFRYCELALLLVSVLVSSTAECRPIVVGSKAFAESYILAEIMSQLLESRGYDVERRFGLGGTSFTYNALLSGDIDVYPDYTGTLSEVVLKQPGISIAQMKTALGRQGISLLDPFGFNNSYAIVVDRKLSEELGITRISDLKQHPKLRLAFSHEFMKRQDGWPGLKHHYQLLQQPRNIEHALSYQAIAAGELDATDAYTTDGELKKFNLLLLEDDLNYFPDYRALPLINKQLPKSVTQVINLLAGRIDETRMQQLNMAVSLEDRDRRAVAAEFLVGEGLIESARQQNDPVWLSIARNTMTHLKLTGTALLLACLVSVSGALLIYRRTRLANAVVYVAGLIQTIPSLALLVLMIPVFGLGELPAVVALFLYSLLPILRNTIAGLFTVDPLLKQVATGMGFTPAQQLIKVELPLAMPTILAGIKTAMILCIGTATLAAFVGAGGLGQPIVTGLALNDTGMILQGAIPAAGLALLAEFLFSLLERWVVPAHLLPKKLS